ncbi:MAG: methyltransferase type 11 [Bacteriovoracaceae bacterium]|nr:methyltransferase type 11 [Bacteriovoracaceae bacterium]
MMISEFIHQNYILNRRVSQLSKRLSELIPKNSKILDIGSGDGHIAAEIMKRRSDIHIVGVDILPRKKTFIDVSLFDGNTIPFNDDSFDMVLLCDMLHHASDPVRVLKEAIRVSRKGILIKDHLREGILADTTLSFMDRVGNRRFSVSLDCTYWNRSEWQKVFKDLELKVVSMDTNLSLYPWPFTYVFDRNLHFIASLSL